LPDFSALFASGRSDQSGWMLSQPVRARKVYSAGGRG